LRIGIGRPAAGSPVAEYVLSAPAKKELETMRQVFEYCSGFMRQMVVGDMASVMSQLNAGAPKTNEINC
jgi:peptidyl-tRNA hydrolase